MQLLPVSLEVRTSNPLMELVLELSLNPVLPVVNQLDVPVLSDLPIGVGLYDMKELAIVCPEPIQLVQVGLGVKHLFTIVAVDHDSSTLTDRDLFTKTLIAHTCVVASATLSNMDCLWLAYNYGALILFVIVESGRDMPRRPLTHRTALGLAHWRRVVRVLLVGHHDLLHLRVEVVVVGVLVVEAVLRNEGFVAGLRGQDLVLLGHLV